MSSSNINISWGVSSKFEESDLEQVLGKYSIIKKNSKSEHEKSIWEVNGLTIKLYEKTLFAQGKNTASGIKIVTELSKLNGLSLDQKNRSKFTALKPVSQNALLCNECGDPIYLIQSSIVGLDISFKNACGHKNTLSAPFNMCVNRIMPDINVLKSRNLSRLVELGFFENCEILVPSYLMKCLDQYLEGSKTTISKEIEQLKQIEKKGNIKIKNFDDRIPIPASRDEFNVEEDTTLLDIADITNSVFITCDINCKDQAILRNRPVIFIDHDTTKDTKILHELRTPSS